VLAQLVRKGVEVRLIHAKEPGPAFREDFDKYPSLAKGLERVLCPRVHFKMLVFDGSAVYFGSANLTDEPELVQQAMQQFDKVWMGLHCAKCLRRKYCGDPIA